MRGGLCVRHYRAFSLRVPSLRAFPLGSQVDASRAHVRSLLAANQVELQLEVSLADDDNTTSISADHSHSSPLDQQDWELEIEELQKLVSLLPASVRSAVEEHSEMTQLLEVVLDLGRPPLARFPSGDKKLSTNVVTREDLEYAIDQVGDFGGDNRAGIDRTLHRISCIRNRRGTVIGLTCRVGRAIWGSSELVRDLIEAGSSVLFLGRPGVGKTTAIREVSRTLSDTLRKRVVIVDTSNEIGGDGDIPHDGIGRARRMQVRDPELQHRVMVEAVENHTPEVIIIDEIGTEAECAAARTIAQRGVQLVATAHGNELENLVKNPSMADLVGGIQSVTLGDEEAKRRGVQKSVLERAAPPTFDVAVEMIERNKWKVHLDVAKAVDALLAGGHPGGQMRERTSDGYIQKTTAMPSKPGSMIRHSTQNGGPDVANARKKTGRRESEREQRLLREEDSAGLSRGSRGDPLTAESGPFSSGMMSSLDSFDDDSAPSSSRLADAGRPANGEVADEEEEDGGVTCFRAKKLRSWQLARGVTDDKGGALTRLLPFDLDPDRVWEIMTALDLVDKIFICDRVDEADAILGLRPRMRTASALRQAAKAQRVPIYAIKNMSAPSLTRALRSLLGMEPSAGGPPPTATNGGRRRIAPSQYEDTEEYNDNGASAFAAKPSRPPSYASLMEAEALEEAEAAIEAIVRPLKQPVELLPRAAEVLRSQAELVARYDLDHEVVGVGVDARLRILPTAPSSSMTAMAPLKKPSPTSEPVPSSL